MKTKTNILPTKYNLILKHCIQVLKFYCKLWILFRYCPIIALLLPYLPYSYMSEYQRITFIFVIIGQLFCPILPYYLTL